MNDFHPCKFRAPMDALLKPLQKGVVPLGQGLTPTSTGPQRGQRWHTPASELWCSRHILLCAVLHTSFFPPVSFPFGFIYKWTVSTFRPPSCSMAQEMIGREGISLQNCLLTLLPVSWEEQSYVCNTWRYTCHSFHSANRRITYISKAWVKPVLLHLIIRCTLFNGEHAAGSHLLSCGSLFYVVVWVFVSCFGLNWEWFNEMAAVRRSRPGLLPATHHTLPSASLLPALTLIRLSTIPFTLSSRQKTIRFLG